MFTLPSGFASGDYQSSPAKFLEDDAKITAMLNTETSSGPSGQMSSEQYGLLEEILRVRFLKKNLVRFFEVQLISVVRAKQAVEELWAFPAIR